ncbi:hypothetical protein [Superficieibacter electus]|uniref:hypothetical protein n=1 Tax=Superficieibacter electus TaxID=2022662 RepID=UPI00105740E8|nr:hypothetical protein [Superficieibacter electus]
MADVQWNSVPAEYVDAWRQLYSAASPEEGIHLSQVCPVCGETALCRYFSLRKPQPVLSLGIMYQGPGSYWEWCTACHTFEHMSGYVPGWWNITLENLDHALLTAIPDLIDAAINTPALSAHPQSEFQ